MPRLSNLFQHKRSFLTAVYATLIVQLCITFAIVYSFRNHPGLSRATKQSMWLYLFVSLALILILSFVPMPTWVKLIVFALFSVVNGALLHHVSVVLPKELIDQALVGTIGVFVGMTILAFILAAMGVDLSWMALLLFGALVGLLVASLVVLFVNPKSPRLQKAIIMFGLVLFAVYVTFETNIMLQKDYARDFVSAAINLYLDFINIFIRMLTLNSN